MKNSNLLTANANLKVIGQGPKNVEYEIDIDLFTDWSIEHDTLIPNYVKIKYLDKGVTLPGKKEYKCACCGEFYTNDKITLRKVKVLGVWDGDGYFEHAFESREEKELLSKIISEMRERFFHGKYLCYNCPPEPESVDFGNELEVHLALCDVKKMYAQQEGVNEPVDDEKD